MAPGSLRNIAKTVKRKASQLSTKATGRLKRKKKGGEMSDGESTSVISLASGDSAYPTRSSQCASVEEVPDEDEDQARDGGEEESAEDELSTSVEHFL